MWVFKVQNDRMTLFTWGTKIISPRDTEAIMECKKKDEITADGIFKNRSFSPASLVQL